MTSSPVLPMPQFLSELHQSRQSVVEKELRMRAVIDNIAEGVVTLDEDGIIETFNRAAGEIFGYSTEEAIGLPITALMPPAMRARHADGMRRFIDTGLRRIVGRHGLEMPGLHKDGTEFRLELSVTSLQLGQRRVFVGIVRDISERKRAEAELYAEKERLRVTLNSIADAVITTDEAGNVAYMNPVAEDMTSWSMEEALGQPIETVFNAIDESTLRAQSGALGGSRALDQLATSLLLRRDGSQIMVQESAAPIRDADGSAVGLVLAFRDVTQARMMTERLNHQATHDALTGLINRREFERRVQQLLERPDPTAARHTLLYFDLDQFKVVNDSCGHIAGDEMLRQLATVLQLKLRRCDTLARLGGDEFGALLENCTDEHGQRIAETLRATAAEFRFAWEGSAFPASVSIGMVTFSAQQSSRSDILRMADSACYVAKDKGRNRVHAYKADDSELARRRGEIDWVARIQRALEEGRFVLYAQRIAAIGAGGGDEHVELLLRMEDEEGRLVTPGSFIPAAERYGLMRSLDRWVIRTALAKLAMRPHERRPTITAINLSGTSIGDDEFLAFVQEQFRTHDVRPASICFEITETAAIANLSQASSLIRSLKAIGCRFALDDFGSGMSSFAYLKHLPVDYLKIDGAFIKGIVDSPVDRAMVEAIHRIGRLMGLATIAEFVENEAILRELDRIGVDMAQGYYIGRPAAL